VSLKIEKRKHYQKTGRKKKRAGVEIKDNTEFKRSARRYWHRLDWSISTGEARVTLIPSL
jgi:hypothetical protein